MSASTHSGPWADTAEAAITNAMAEVNTSPEAWVRLDYGSAPNLVIFVPINEDGPHEIHAEIFYSENREQYKAKLARRPHFGDGN